MQSSTALLLLASLLSTASAQNSACPYVAVSNFPTTGVCYPTTYYAAQDEGQFSGSNGAFATQLMAKCQATCDGQSQCLSFVGVVNEAADSDLATGTCFFYSTQQVSPRQCADSPSEIIAYYKQNSVNGVCSVAATSSSTTLSMTTAGLSTTSSSSSSSSSSSASSSTASSSSYHSTTSSSSSPGFSTASPSTTSSSSSSSSTASTSTASTSTTSSSSSSSSTASSSTASSTNIISNTASSTAASSTTSSSSSSSSSTASSTTAGSTTSSSSSSSSTTGTTTSTATTGTTTTSATTTSCTATVTPGSKACTNNGAGTESAGQCGTASAQCGCYLDEGTGGGYCALYFGACDTICNTDSDCPCGQACLNASATGCGGNVCSGASDSDLCDTNTSAKMLFKPRGLSYRS